MIFQATISTAASTTKGAYKLTRLRLTTGLVYRIEVEWPPPGSGLAGVAIFDGSLQLWPATAAEWFIDNGLLVGFDDLFLKEAPPYEFQIRTYNLDDTFAHSVMVRVGLVSKEAFRARFMPNITWEKFQLSLQRLYAHQQVAFMGAGLPDSETLP